MKFNTEKFAKIDIVSFDVFNTLLNRNVPNPADVFSIIEKKSGIIGFANKRKEAALMASNKAQNGEATLKDIYDCLELTNREKLLQLELETERDILVANPDIKPLYDWCRENEKIIIAVSDMYLPSDFLSKCLKNNGYIIDHIFVSCEVKENKRTGTMFDYISCQYETKNIIHIGDSFKSDYLLPLKHGWKTYRYIPKKHSNSFIDSVCENCLYDDYFEALGFKVLGPMIYCFAKWLDEKSKNMDSIMFFSRDGMIMREAFKRISDRKTSYLYVSRQSLNTAALWLHPEFNELPTSIIVTRNFTVTKFVKRLGLIPNDFNYERYGIDRKKDYLSEEFWNDSKIQKFYDDIKEKAISNSKEQYEFLLSYLESKIQGKEIGIVDIGWKGTMQKRLTELLMVNPKYRDCRLHGYYFGIEFEAENVDGFLYRTNKQSKYKTAIDAGFGLIETLFLAREGSTISYNQNGYVQDDYEIKNISELVKLKNIHKGALEFCDVVKKIDYGDLMDQSNNIAFREFKKLVYKPTDEDILMLGNIGFKDSEDTTLIVRRSFKDYYSSPRQFIMDYHKAPWKIGFLKENVFRTIPWGHIYSAIKNG